MSDESWRAAMVPSRFEAGVVDVWRVDLDDPRWDDAARLSERERERLAALRGGTVRQRWGASRRALRSVLGLYLGDESSLPEEFACGPYGKPMLSAGYSIRFNLSHSAGLALIAVSGDREVGIDLEEVDLRRDVDALIPRALDREAAAEVVATPAAERPFAFYRAWVRREAVVKCGGEGLGGKPSGGAVALTSIDPGAGYVAALAVAAAHPATPRLLIATPPLRRSISLLCPTP